MPPLGYLSNSAINQSLSYLQSHYSICQRFRLPERSVEGRWIYGIRIAGGDLEHRHAVLLIGGVHARELINPDLLVSFALDLCDAYDTGSDLTFGPKTYTAFQVRLIVEALEIYIVPLVNPDGRRYVQMTGGDPWWRKNRSPNPGQPCRGVDLNRNYDFLWPSGIGTSTSSCSEVFKGSGAFSEPETRNVRWLLDTYPNIECMVDVHSYTELVLYPWGDDDSQTVDPAMNFQNPAYNGQRGVVGAGYREYMPQADLDWHADTGARIRDAIAAVRGRAYTLKPSVLLYPTSGTSKDYSYSRHFVDATKRRIYAYTIETAREFQPPYTEALNVISEVSSGLTQFCLSCLCPVRFVFQHHPWDELEGLFEILREAVFLPTAAGQRYLRLIDAHALEATELLAADERLRERTDDVLQRVGKVAATWKEKEPRPFEPALIDELDEVFRAFEERGSAELREAIEEVRRDLDRFRGRTLAEGLQDIGS
jgi:carboxypeptidase T